MAATPCRILMLGDVVGQPGLRAVFFALPTLVQEFRPDHVAVNIENSADGHGSLPEHLKTLEQVGVRVFTGGNHTFEKAEFFPALENANVLRPANYSKKLPGKGWYVCGPHHPAAFLNLQGRSRLVPIEDPFPLALDLVQRVKKETKCIIVDFHAESTEEKEAMAFHLDGLVSAVLGTHTHTPTSDERVLPGGTFFLTDLGMCGSTSGVIGSSAVASVERMVRGIPARADPPQDKLMVQGIFLEIEQETGKVIRHRRILHPVNV